MAAILAFAGSNSSTSINYVLVQHTTSLIDGHEVRLLNMTGYPFPMYSVDEDRQKGFSNSLVELKNDIQRSEGIILSVNEHNGNPSAYFKNTMDWLSRLDRKFMRGTRILLMSTSLGKGGGAKSLEVVKHMLPRFGADVVSTFSLPLFHENFVGGIIVEHEMRSRHQYALNSFLEKLK